MICERSRAHKHADPTRLIGIMNTRLIISLLCAGALAFACGPRSHSEAPTTLANALPIHTSDVKAAVKTVVERPRSKSKEAKTDARIDTKLNVSVAERDVRLALDVKNVGGKYAELTFTSGQAYDFA